MIGINSVIEEAIDALPRSARTDKPMIRQWINDTLDMHDKDGQKVNFDYDQDRAVRLIVKGLTLK